MRTPSPSSTSYPASVPSTATTIPALHLPSSSLLAPPLPLPVPLRINLRRERILPLPREQIDSRDFTRQQDPRRATVQESRPQEGARRAPIHGRLGDVEWKPRHLLIHQNPEIIAEKRARDAEGIVRCQDQRVADREEDVRCDRGQEGCGDEGLGSESALEQVVASQADAEDCDGEDVAARVWGVEGLGQGFVVVFCQFRVMR